eukprot:8908669-Pyramimonas_sp.AAC.1
MPLCAAAERGLQELPIFVQPRGDHGPKCEGRAAEALSNEASPSQRDNPPLQHGPTTEVLVRFAHQRTGARKQH